VSNNALEVAEQSNIIFFCVGTPCDENGKADLQYLFNAIDSILPAVKKRTKVLIIKSTIPPGTTQTEIIPHIQNRLADTENIMIVNNPEFLREGKCWQDFLFPDRIVCGINNKETINYLQKLYDPFNAPVHFVSLNTGEFIKYLSNTLLSTLISYSNEMSIISEQIGNIDVDRAFHILHEDKRLKGSGINTYIYPGCGFGGYCLPKDTQAMVSNARAKGVEPGILSEVIKTNESMPEFFFNKIKKLVCCDTELGILGLSFKPESDDVRDSPAAKIIKLLLADGYKKLYAFDPIANEGFNQLYQFPHINYLSSAEEVCETSSLIIVVTAWNSFKDLQTVFPDKIWVDCRYFMKKKTHER
jgi:UDPglucose 6-dehydrogenase